MVIWVSFQGHVDIIFGSSEGECFGHWRVVFGEHLGGSFWDPRGCLRLNVQSINGASPLRVLQKSEDHSGIIGSHSMFIWGSFCGHVGIILRSCVYYSMVT